MNCVVNIQILRYSEEDQFRKSHEERRSHVSTQHSPASHRIAAQSSACFGHLPPRRTCSAWYTVKLFMLFAADNFLRTCQKKAATASEIATTSQSCCKVNISKLVQVSPKHDGLIREKLRSPLRLHHRENEVKHVVLTGVTRRPLKCH